MSAQASAQVAELIENDAVYTANMAAVVHRYKQGKISDHMFCHYQDWLTRSALRRRGLTIHNGFVVRRVV